MYYQRNLEKKFRINKNIKNYTTFKIGGRVKYFFEPQNIEDLKIALDFAKRKRIKIYVLGGGSNVLITDKVLRALVIQLSHKFFKRITLKNNILSVGAGVRLKDLLSYCLKKRLGNLEFLAGIPGTVGGALVMNAGTKDKSFSEVVEEVTIMDYNKNVRVFKKDEIEFSYRDSSLSKYIILEASLRLKKESSERIRKNIREYLKYRYASQELNYPCAGCVFKNPSDQLPAGKLIDLCGLKGTRIGDACVSLQHANFIVNLGKARYTEVLKLIKLIQRKVKEKFNIELETEIKIWE